MPVISTQLQTAGGSGGVCADATIEINGAEFGTVASGGTIDIPVIQDGAPVGSKVGDDWVIPAKRAYGSCYRTTASASEDTELTTNEWIAVTMTSLLSDASAEQVIKHVGNARWENEADDSRTLGLL